MGICTIPTSMLNHVFPRIFLRWICRCGLYMHVTVNLVPLGTIPIPRFFFFYYETFNHVWTTTTRYTHRRLLRSFNICQGDGSYLITYCQSTSLSRYVERDFYRNTSFFGQPVVGTLAHTNARKLIRFVFNHFCFFHP